MLQVLDLENRILYSIGGRAVERRPQADRYIMTWRMLPQPNFEGNQPFGMGPHAGLSIVMPG